MKIVLDMQGAQSGSRFRGIGRYATALARALLQESRGHEIWFALSGRLPETIEPLLAEFDGLLDPARVRVFELPGPLEERTPGNAWRMQAAERLRETFLADLRPDVVHVMSMFEGLGNDVVASIGDAVPALPTSAVLYDLIPLMRPDAYLANPAVRRAYFRRAQAMKRADLLLAISESARGEGIALLDLPPERVVNISAGVEPFFHPVTPDAPALLARYGLSRAVVLYTGAVDPRKNVEGLIEAFTYLPAELRALHQIGLVGRLDANDRKRILAMVRRHRLREDELVFTGYVPDEDLRALYSVCAAFVFPSLHEGFGLPALEAMACGAPTIGSNTTSIPEVIGRADAMFDPTRPREIAARMQAVLTDAGFRDSLRESGLHTARLFTWQASARRALAAFEALHETRKPVVAVTPRPRLAFLSPLPPERSGIAGYAARLLPELALHYDITCIADQIDVEADWITANFAMHDMNWFAAHADGFDRILYQFGNAPFHRHMLPLLERHPGVVMLHDVCLGGLMAWRARLGGETRALDEAIYRSHGYTTLLQRDSDAVLPANSAVLRNALRVLVHSQHAVDLVRAWYGDDAVETLRQVPFLPHPPPPAAEPAAARRRLGLDAKDFVVCSFGSVFPTKLNHRLLEAWLRSKLAADPRCRLVFVGSYEDNPYEARLARLLAGRPEAARIRVTGYADDAAYADWQAAADVAVQLRTGSRGESSGAIHESLARGLPLILNAHGAAAEVPGEVVLRLPDAFTTEALAEALQRLRADAPARAALGARAAAYARTRHHPPLVARRYRELIEDAYATAPRAREQALLRSLAAIPLPPPGADDLAGVALAMAANRPRFGRPRILFDVSSLSRTEFVTGIERVTRAVLGELIQAPPDGWRIEPVRIEGDGYVYARDWTSRFLGIAPPAPDEPVEAAGGDLFLGLDWTADRVPGVVDWFRRQRRRGVRIVFMVHDILPVQRPALFPPAIAPMVLRWLDTLGEVADGLVCPSAAVMGEVADWLQAHPPARLRPLRLGYFHLGADFGGVEAEAAAPPALAAALAARPGFLMVGTVEPRKGHRQALYAMEALWAGGGDANLVIVGRAGWTSDDLIARLRGHPEQGRRLFWLESATDAVLELLYRQCSALLAASEAEGFGLPLIEAAQRGLKILARDIPVFREVAGPHAAYFRAETPAALAAAMRDWLARHARGDVPASAGMPRQSWRQATAALLRVALAGEWQGVWPAEVVARAVPGHVA